MKGALILEDRTGEASFPLRLAHKDAQLITETGAAGELAPAVQRAFARASEAGLGRPRHGRRRGRQRGFRPAIIRL